nr:ABC transporter A family member 9-like [Tanacetum cinerariifolium]
MVPTHKQTTRVSLAPGVTPGPNSGVRSGISAGKEVDTEPGGGCDKVLRPADMLLYSWDSWFNVCVDLTGSSPLTWTGMADFVSGRAVIDVAQRKRGKYMAKCVAIGYGFC